MSEDLDRIEKELDWNLRSALLSYFEATADFSTRLDQLDGIRKTTAKLAGLLAKKAEQDRLSQVENGDPLTADEVTALADILKELNESF